MKKLLFLLIFCTVGKPAVAQLSDFLNLLTNFKSMEPYGFIGSYEMSQNTGNYVDNQLAWKYLWQQNKFMKPEETFCQTVGWYVIEKKGGNIAVVIFFTGQKDNAVAYMLSIQTYNIKTEKMIDELRNVASFGADEGKRPACRLQRTDVGVKFTTTDTFSGDTVINLEITSNGKIKEVK